MYSFCCLLLSLGQCRTIRPSPAYGSRWSSVDFITALEIEMIAAATGGL